MFTQPTLGEMVRPLGHSREDVNRSHPLATTVDNSSLRSTNHGCCLEESSA